MGFLDKIQSKLELYRLEQRYARRKNRSTFTTGALYVDGEYVYPNAGNPSPAVSTSAVSKQSTGSFQWSQSSRWGRR